MSGFWIFWHSHVIRSFPEPAAVAPRVPVMYELRVVGIDINRPSVLISRSKEISPMPGRADKWRFGDPCIRRPRRPTPYICKSAGEPAVGARDRVRGSPAGGYTLTVIPSPRTPASRRRSRGTRHILQYQS
jgi:hypothetical protein